DEVIGVDAGLVAIGHLVSGLVADLLPELRGVEGSAGLDLVRPREVDLLRDQLVVNLPGRERASPRLGACPEGLRTCSRPLRPLRIDPRGQTPQCRGRIRTPS